MPYNFVGKRFYPTSCGVTRNQNVKIRRPIPLYIDLDMDLIKDLIKAIDLVVCIRVFQVAGNKIEWVQMRN